MSKIWKNPNDGYMITQMDIVFCMINLSLNRFEGICATFNKETEKVLEVFEKISLKDRPDIIRQAYILKQLTVEMTQECKNKSDCLQIIDSVTPLNAQDARSKTRFLAQRIKQQTDAMAYNS